MKRRYLAMAVALTLCFSLMAGGCTAPDNTNISIDQSDSATNASNTNNTEAGTTETATAEDAEENKVDITGDFAITTDTADGYTESEGVYTITKAGEYTLTGSLSEGQVVVAAGEEDEVTLILAGTSITSTTASPICILSAASVEIKAEEDTYSEIIDDREAKSDADTDVSDDTDATEDTDMNTARNAAIFSRADLELSGKGSLVVIGNYYNGIQSKNDLYAKHLTLKVMAYNSALKGRNSVDITSGEMILISTGGDGIKTSYSGLTDAGNQKGDIVIEGGNIDIYAACDGIDAAHDALVSGDTNLNIHTASYSDYTGSVAASGTDFYLVIDSSTYSEDYDYYAYYYNSEEGEDSGVFVKATYETMIRGGWNASYYGLLVSEPSGYDSVAFFRFTAGETASITDYDACTEGDAVNTAMNAYLVDSISSGSITGDYVNLTTGNGGGGNSDKAACSAKGIKAADEVVIEDGVITISAQDDGIHANADALDNGETGAGSVTINGGTITITAADDGIHGENSLEINGGTINIPASYEGLEAVTITINDGRITVYASDDGVNAGSSSTAGVTPSVNINGGYLEVTTPSGDTDGIDSNGNYVQSGGFVFVKGGASTGSMAGSIDVDGSITVSGGTTVAIGGICETPVNSVNAYASSGTSFSAGDFVLTDGDGKEILSFSLSDSYSSVWIASDQLVTGSEYTLTKDDTLTTLYWTQEEGTMGASSGGFGGGGFGGGGFGGGGFGGGGHH